MGEETGNYYSPATFVAKAIKHHSNENKCIIQEWFSCEGVSFSGVAPGFTGNFVSIWAFAPNQSINLTGIKRVLKRGKLVGWQVISPWLDKKESNEF